MEASTVVERFFLKLCGSIHQVYLDGGGALGQQLSLVAESMELGSCMLGSYFDDEVNEMLGVDGALESVQNVMVVGVPG